MIASLIRARPDKLGQARFDFPAVRFQPGRKHERLAQTRAIFINREAWTFGSELEKDAARFLEIDGLEPESIDYRGRLCAFLGDTLAHFELMRLIVHAPGDVMNAAGAPGAADGCWFLSKINVSPGFPVADAIAMPAVLRSEMPKAHR